MIFPTVLIFMAVAALVGMMHVTSLWVQIVLAFWAVVLTIGAAQTSTDEAIEKYRQQRAKGIQRPDPKIEG